MDGNVARPPYRKPTAQEERLRSSPGGSCQAELSHVGVACRGRGAGRWPRDGGRRSAVPPHLRGGRNRFRRCASDKTPALNRANGITREFGVRTTAPLGTDPPALPDTTSRPASSPRPQRSRTATRDSSPTALIKRRRIRMGIRADRRRQYEGAGTGARHFAASPSRMGCHFKNMIYKNHPSQISPSTFQRRKSRFDAIRGSDQRLAARSAGMHRAYLLGC